MTPQTTIKAWAAGAGASTFQAVDSLVEMLPFADAVPTELVMVIAFGVGYLFAYLAPQNTAIPQPTNHFVEPGEPTS